MKIMTFNVRIWTRDTDSSANTFWKKRMARMEELISRENPDVICFQEMMFPATCYIPSGYKRVGISAHHSIFIKKNNGIKTRNHKFKIFYEYVDITIPKYPEFRLFNIHTRWEDNIAARTFTGVTEDMKCHKCILCGDFNAELEDARRNGLVGTSVREDLGIEKKDTFQNYTKEYQHGELDHFIVYNIWGLPSSYKIASDYDVSDHKSVIIEY